MGLSCEKISIGGVWSRVKQELYINAEDSRGARAEGSKFCDTNILQIQKGSSSPCTNQAALVYLVKMGRTRNLLTIQEAREIWEFSLANQITLIAEYLLGTLNTWAGKASRKMKSSSSEWILNKAKFQKLIQTLGPVDVDLFVSRMCHQIPKYISWQPDPHAWMVDAFQINRSHLKAYDFRAFALIERVLAKPMRDKCSLVIITPAWSSQPRYIQLLRISMQDSIFIPPFPNLLTDPNQNQHSLCQNQTLTATGQKVSGNSILQKAHQTKQLTCLEVADDQAHCIITKRVGKSDVARSFKKN